MDDERWAAFQALLHEHSALPLAHRCLTALAQDAVILHLSPRSVPGKAIRDIYERRAGWNQARKGAIEGFDTLLPALAQIADIGASVCMHSVSTPEEWFVVFPDVEMRLLIGILTERSGNRKRDTNPLSGCVATCCFHSAR